MITVIFIKYLNIYILAKLKYNKNNPYPYVINDNDYFSKDTYIMFTIKQILWIIIIIVIILYLISIDSIRNKVINLNIIKKILKKPLEERNIWIHKKIYEFLPNPPARIMNFGCGLNNYSDYLVKNGYEVLAIDINDISKMKYFSSLFGREQCYLSFIRK